MELQTPPNIITRKSCRVCNSNYLEPILSLGNQCLTNFVDSSDEKLLVAPLELVLCSKKNGGCGLLQLKHTVPGDILYRKFWYKSGVNQTIRDDLTDIAHTAENMVELNEGDIVLDIGANDGTLLRQYKHKNLKSIGFEPAVNLVEEAQVGTTKILNDYFNYEKYKDTFDGQKAKIITSISMFYDLEDPNKFVTDIIKILDNDGIWVIQMNYLVTMLENNAFDNIVHEHLEYYSLKSLEYLLRKHDLMVFDVKLNSINGGSIRTYVKHKSCQKYSITKRVDELRDHENKLRLDDTEPYVQFSNRIQDLRKKTCNFIKTEVAKGKKIYVYGASTRGNTLLQFYNLDHTLITAAIERNPEKWGKKTVLTDIPIISEEEGRNKKPDYFLILPWYFIEEFQQREHDYLKNGGKFIVPIPNFKIINPDEIVNI